MSKFAPTDDLSRAIDVLTVQAVWAAVPGLPPVPRAGNVLVKSPFREDRNKSFSICFKGHGWRDQASADKGGVWAFAQKATAKDGKELADWLIELSGIARTPVRRAPLAQGDSADAESEPGKPSRRAKPKPYASPAAKAMLAEQHAKALVSQVAVRAVPNAPAFVKHRWQQGVISSFAEALAAERGWPSAWVFWVYHEGLISWPLLPWIDSVRDRADERGVAFKVQWMNGAGLGYHQRFVIRGEKSWVYVPYLPAEDRCRSEFQRQLRAEALSRGADDAGDALLPGMPFVLQGGAECANLVITEGQWDAITFAGACGWLDSDTAWPEGWWVLGARGSNGADTLLAYWGPWLQLHKPRVLVLADNDKASLSWDHGRMAGESAPWTGPWEFGVVPSFKEKLKALGCPLVEVRRVNAAHGKDFNDYWKAKRPTPGAMAKWLAGCLRNDHP